MISDYFMNPSPNWGITSLPQDDAGAGDAFSGEPLSSSLRKASNTSSSITYSVSLAPSKFKTSSRKLFARLLHHLLISSKKRLEGVEVVLAFLTYSFRSELSSHSETSAVSSRLTERN